jgi:hypothetical protein
METILTIAQSGLGTAELFLRRKAAKEKDAAKKKKLLKVAAVLKAANESITDILTDEAFA